MSQFAIDFHSLMQCDKEQSATRHRNFRIMGHLSHDNSSNESVQW
jgi:hypothetical protein